MSSKEESEEIYKNEPPKPEPLNSMNLEWAQYDPVRREYQSYIQEHKEYYIWSRNGYTRKYK